MPSNRIEILKTMLEQDPANNFARYGIAMEYLNSGELDQAVAAFGNLTEINPDYVAAYFHGGQTLEKLGRTEDARAVYARGLEACRRTGDGHTASEISAALDLL
jgi:tetratricopeptide (TPR) repeat protein